MPDSAARPLWGRSPELSILAGLLEGTARGAGQMVVIEGEAGIGKTSLLSEILKTASQQGFQVFRGRADELDHDRSFGPLTDALSLHPGSSDPDQAALGRILKGLPSDAAASSADLGFRIVDGIVDLLERVAVQTPVVLAIDDLHWADPSTLRTVRSIARHLGHLPVALFATCRPFPRSADLDRAVDDVLVRGGRRLVLDGLDGAAVDALVGEATGAPPGPRLLAQLRGAGGNPLFVLELVRSLLDEGALQVTDNQAEVSEASLPPTLRLTILRRLSFLAPETLDLLAVASILGTSFSLTQLSAIVGRRAVELLPALNRAVTAGVLGEAGEHLAFRHDLIREAIYTDLPLAVRKGLHRDTGQALAATGAPVAQVAAQLSLGAEAGDMEAVGWLRRSARETAPRSPALAIELWDRALALLPETSAERDEVVAESAPAHILLGRGAEAAVVIGQSLSRSPTPEVEVALRRARGEIFWAHGRITAAAIELEGAYSVAGGPEGERAGALALAANARFFMGDVARAEDEAEQARADAQRLGDDLTACLALQTLALVADARGLVDQAVATAEQAVALAGRLRHPRAGFLYPHLYLGLVLIDADRLDDATAAVQEGRRLAEERGTTLWLPLYHFALAYIRAVAGAWGDTSAEAEAGLAVADEVGTRLHAPFLHGVRAWAAIQQGDLGSVEARLVSAVDEFVALAGDEWIAAEARGGVMAAGPQWPVEYGNWIAGLLREAQGDLASAAVSLGQAWDLAAPTRFFLSSRFFGPDLVRVALKVGDRDRAQAVTAELEEGARRAPVATALGAAQLCRGLVDDDPDVLLLAVDAYRAGPRPAEMALACEAAGLALARAGRTAEAIRLLEDARAAFERLGCQLSLARAEAALRALGVRHRRATRPRRATIGWDSLTDTEEEVVRQVAQGLTNRQVGERLFISRRTVETHLAHVFQKLGVSSRAQLAAEAGRRMS